jgi:erythromycin esterase-like protein
MKHSKITIKSRTLLFDKQPPLKDHQTSSGRKSHQSSTMIPPVEDLLRINVTELPPVTDPSFANYFHQFGKYKVVLIGDGSHGTSEFYTARAKITEHLIQHHGFNVVALEADWPDAEAIDRYVRRRAGPRTTIEVTESEPAFKRFPTWMVRLISISFCWFLLWEPGACELFHEPS